MLRLPEVRTGERGFTKSPVFPIKVGTAAPGGTQVDLLPWGGCPHLCLSRRAGILPPATGAGDPSDTLHLVSVDLQASLPRMSWEGLNSFRGSANPGHSSPVYSLGPGRKHAPRSCKEV